MVHECDELIVIIASDTEYSVIFADELYRLSQLFCWEPCFDSTQIELCYQAECYSVAMKYRSALQGPALESVAEGVPEIQSLAESFLRWVFEHDALLHFHRVGHHLLQLFEVGVMQIVVHQLGPHVFIGYETMLEHLGIAAADVLLVERFKEISVENHKLGIVEHPYFILQPVEVDTRLSTY